MMPVIVNNQHIVLFALFLETAPHAVKFGKPFHAGFRGNARFQGHSYGGQGVQHIVASGLGKIYFAKFLSVQKHFEPASGPAGYYFRPDGIVRTQAVGQNAALHLGKNPLHARVVSANHIQAVKRNFVHECNERVVDCFLI